MNNPTLRREQSREKRNQATQIAFNRKPELHNSNNEEFAFEDTLLMSFTKGLEHDPRTGLLKYPGPFKAFVRSVEFPGSSNFRMIPISLVAQTGKWRSAKAANAQYRAWESAGAGSLFDLLGPDAQVYTMIPAPGLSNTLKLSEEMRDIYLQALLRDFPLNFFYTADEDDLNVRQKEWLQKIKVAFPDFDAKIAFRGDFFGDSQGPYLSQFMLMGSKNLKNENKPREGYIQYGSQVISQKIRAALSGEDHMQEWDEWLDVQEGASLIRKESYIDPPLRRFIHTGRDLATYVHYDALYQAYLNACLLLWSYDVPLDEGLPFQLKDLEDKQQGFAHFGGPHILSLVTEVATRALKAVRFQKFNVHRRLRPEALAARIQMQPTFNDHAAKHFLNLLTHELQPILELVNEFNNQSVESFSAGYMRATGLETDIEHNYLLPMAFCEGSPMHPSYGAGHATVAGACITILKAFFNTDYYLALSADGSEFELTKEMPTISRGFITGNNGTILEPINLDVPLKIEGELNKLAANVSIGRNWAGVHYKSDYRESLLLGEKIAIGILQEQSITYNEMESDFVGGAFMYLAKFDGTKVYLQNGNILDSSPLKK